MDLKEIKRLIEIVEEAKISHFNIEIENMKIEIKKEFSQSVVHAPLVLPTASPVMAHPAPAPEITPDLPKKDDKLVAVKSQMVGTFYSSSSPEAAPYVKVGDTVNVGQVICIVEAMKLFNEIESDIAGVVEKVCVANATPVEYGQELFLIRIA